MIAAKSYKPIAEEALERATLRRALQVVGDTAIEQVLNAAERGTVKDLDKVLGAGVTKDLIFDTVIDALRARREDVVRMVLGHMSGLATARKDARRRELGEDQLIAMGQRLLQVMPSDWSPAAASAAEIRRLHHKYFTVVSIPGLTCRECGGTGCKHCEQSGEEPGSPTTFCHTRRRRGVRG